ncbi:MAG: 50S ribosomal protein L25/general stress protein Ctc [Xanthomonadales bacterium]|nr:50S ribosomal protein L25/general stress protein Ctc [Xanthomonadales bacterium]
MATSHKIEVQLRDAGGKGASRRLRHAGTVPAIVYGGDLPPVSIQMNHNTVWLLSQNEWFYSAILDLSLDGDVQPVLLRDMQRHPHKQQILHLDFLRVKADEILRTPVQLHFLNEDVSPAGKTAGVVISRTMTEVEVACLPRDLPEFIAVDLSDFTVGQILHLSDLKLPEGVEIPQLKLGADHDQAIVMAREVREEIDPVEGEDDVAGEGDDKEA